MKLYISDLDGTLLNSQEKLSENTIHIINNLIETKGLNFTIATARSIRTSKIFIEQLNLKFPVILNNGVYIYDPVSRKNLEENFIQDINLLEIVRIIEKHGLHPIVYSIDDYGFPKVYYTGIFNYGEKAYIQQRLNENDKRFELIKKFDTIPHRKIITILVIDKKEHLEDCIPTLKKKFILSYNFLEDIYSKYYWLEITNIKASKKHGVKFLKAYLHVSTLISFGDNLNDLPMFEESDEKYAVLNAKDELKKCATRIIGSNDNDGVALFLQNYFNSGKQ